MKLVEKIDDLNGAIIGAVAEYHYPLLDKLFSSGAIQRENAPSEESAYRKQLYGRVHYTIMRSADFQYRQHIDRAAQELAISPLVITRTPVYCALSKKSAISLDEFSKAQERLLQKTSFSDYLQRYF